MTYNITVWHREAQAWPEEDVTVRMRMALSVAACLLTGCGSSGGSGPADGGAGTGGSGTGSGSGGGAGGSTGTTVGLDARPANLTCVAPELGDTETLVTLEPAFPGIALNAPLALLQAPNEDSRWFAMERAGTVRVFDNTPGVSVFNTDFISIPVNTTREGGLLGMAFDPDFAANGRAYLSWTEGDPMQSVVARFTSTDGGLTLDPGSFEEIVRIDQDFATHNGGNIAFGNDGFLYFGVGDGGSANDPNNRAQDTTSLLGAMLRLDVSGAGPGYDVPADNPFAANAQCPADHSSTANCPELFAWGLRNPWRWSFDAATGDLWLGDVGQAALEEVNRIEQGGNFGWDCREGSIANNNDPSPLCSSAPMFVEPVFAYDRSQGDVSITGGFVYRGSDIPSLFGADGELFVLDGGIQRIVEQPSAPAASASTVASQLSATGCFDAQDPADAVAGMLPYDINAPFWSDGADKERWLAIPDGTTMSIDADGDFEFPPGAVLAKHFRLGDILVETRLLMHHPDGTWAGYTYEWNADGTDAERVIGGKVAQKAGQDWIFPSEGECMSCHTQAAQFALGTESAQMNRDITYEATGRTHNQLETLDAIGMFTSPLNDPATLPAFAEPFDSSADLDSRARSYLHSNCAQCHRPDGPTPVDLDLRAATLLENTGACSIAPTAGDLGIANAQIVAPGDAALSVLTARMNRRDTNAMPPLGSNLIDADGVTLIEEWINGLDENCL